MDNKQFKVFLKYFVACAAIVIFMVFFLWKNEIFAAFASKLFMIMRPLIVGGFIAFVLNRPFMKIEAFYCRNFNKKSSFSKSGKSRNWNVLSLVTVYFLLFLLVGGIIGFIVPQFVSSVKFFADSFDSYYSNFQKFWDKYTFGLDLKWLEDFDILNKLYKWLESFVGKIPEMLTTALDVTKNIISGVADVFVGLIFSIYVLAGKNKLKRQTGMLFRSLLSEKNYQKLVWIYRLVADTFSNFINGQLTEAFILGILCFIGMTVLRFPYAILISVIIGITNIIPIFGPIIGTIPGAFILLLVDPIKAVWFVVFVIILQQIDSNLIYPRVVGASVGLSPIWIMIAITIGGGLFGIIGMVLAVPTMSIIYVLTSNFVEKKLKTKESSEDLKQNRQ